MTPTVVTTLASGATISPLWTSNAHLTNYGGADGWAAFCYWMMNAKRSDGSYVFSDPGTTRPIVWLGDSWASGSTAQFPAAVHQRFPSAVATVAGVGGNTSAMMIARFGTDVPTNAAYVIINEPGVNDIYQSVSQTTMAKNLQTLIGLIRAIGAIPVVTGMVPLIDFPGAALTAEGQLKALSLPTTKVLPVQDTASQDARYAGLVSPVFASTQAIAQPSQNLLLDPGFDTGTGWVVGAGWVISGSAAAHTTGNVATLAQNWTVVATEIYLVTVTITGRTTGSVTVGLGAASVAAITATSTVPIYTTGSGVQSFAITPTTDFNGSLTAISLNRTGIAYPVTTHGTLEVRSPSASSFAIGCQAQTKLTTPNDNQGTGNIAIGQNAQIILTTGYNNLSAGYVAGVSLTSGFDNVSLGSGAGNKLTSASSNVHVGQDSGNIPNAVSGNASTTANFQTCVGAQTGQGSATQSTAIVTIGYQATASGNYAVAVGYLAAAGAAAAVAIGQGASAGATNAVAIGQGASASATGSVAIGKDTSGTTASSATVDEIGLGTANHTTRIAGYLRLDRGQTTVGAAGAASALPATPTKYLSVKDSTGTEYVVPVYAKV